MNARRRAGSWRSAFAVTGLSLGLAFPAARAGEPQSGEPGLHEILARAARSYERQDYKAARRAYEQATRIDPGSVGAWRGLGWTLWQLGDRERAIQIWRDLLRVQPGDPDIQLSLAQAHEYRHQWPEALELYSSVLDVQQDRTPARLGRARVYRALGRDFDAERDLDVLLDRHPAHFDARFMLAEICNADGRTHEAASIFEQLAQEGPAPERLRPLADSLLQLGRGEASIQLYRQHLDRRPEDRAAVLGLARAYALNHRYADAIPVLENFLQRDPADSKLRERLVQFAGYSGDHGRAQKHLRVLLRDNPRNDAWRMRLARSLQSAGEVDEPAMIARQVLREAPDDVDALELLLETATYRGHEKEAIHWLERLITIAPTAARLNRLGELQLQLGDELAAGNDALAAREHYRKAATTFRRAMDSDPLSADAWLGASTALRLAGEHEEAIALAQQLLDRHPAVVRARREIYEASLSLGDHARAEEQVRRMMEFNAGSVRLLQAQARARFHEGERAESIAAMEALLRDPAIARSVPVLLYHGISQASTRSDAMSQRNFRDQMLALKRAGYEPIDIHRLLAFYENGAALPERPVMITFDDARSDSFRYADPVLEEVGFRVTMFVPVDEVGQRGSYNAVWSTIREMYRSGRWDIQCHGDNAHEHIPVDENGTRGAFLAHRMWLAEAGRLETHAEFVARVEADYRSCGERLRAELPGLEIAGYAYPFGELGQKALSNEPQAIAVNKALVKKYYRVGFIQDSTAKVTGLSEATVLPRFEVPAHFTGNDLLAHLRGNDERISTQLLLADLYAWDGRYPEAEVLLNALAEVEGVDQADLLTRRGRIRMWQGDLAEARRHLDAAVALRDDSRTIRDNLEQIDRSKRPETVADSAFYSDNRDRSSFSAGPSTKLHLSDRLALTAGYRYRQLSDDGVPPERVPATTARTAPAAEDEADFLPMDLRVVGNELEAQLAYRWDRRTELALAAGAAHFEDRSSQRVFDTPGTFPLASATLRFPIGSVMDATLRARHGYVAAAGTILDGLASTGGEGRMQIRLLSATTLDTRYAYTHYDDGNARNTGVVALMQQVRKVPDVRIGYRFTFDHAQESNPLFYTPDRYMGNDGVLRLTYRPSQLLSLEAETVLGSGQERGGERKFQASFSGTGRVQLAESFSLFASGTRSQAAEYESFQITGGMSLTY